MIHISKKEKTDDHRELDEQKKNEGVYKRRPSPSVYNLSYQNDKKEGGREKRGLGKQKIKSFLCFIHIHVLFWVKKGWLQIITQRQTSS